MKITYLKLVGCIYMKSALDANSIELDLSKSKNNIILFTAKNGRGKTSLLSTLHPFAYNGSFDDRDNILMIEGEKGYKEIHIQDDDDKYIIKHFYTPSKNSHIVKSYIEKNGLELNPNGNVTSFKSLVEEELQLEPSYLQLLRLGSNVTNFIDLSPTERKSYMGKKLSDAEIFITLHKKISNNMRELNGKLTNITAKLNKLGITDLKVSRKYLSELSIKLDELNKVYMNISNQKAIMDNDLNNLGNIDELNRNYDRLIYTFDDMNELYKGKKYKHLIEQIDILDSIKARHNDMKNQYVIESNIKASLINTLDKIYSDKKELKIQLDKESNEEEINSLKKIISELSNMVELDEKRFKNANPNYTSDDVKEVISLSEQAQNIISMAYEFGPSVLKKVAKHMKRDDVEEFVNKKISTISSNKTIITSNSILNDIFKKFPIMYANCDDETCPIYTFWNDFYELASKTPETEDLNNEEYYSYISMAYKNIKAGLAILKEKNMYFKRMPSEIQSEYLMENIYKRISNCEHIYSIQQLNSLLSYITEYEVYMSNKDKLMEYKARYTQLVNSPTKTFIANKLESVENEIMITDDQLNQLNNKLDSDKIHIDELSNNIEIMDKIYVYIKEKDALKEQFEEISDKIQKYKSLSDKVYSLNSLIEGIKLEIKNVDNDRSKLDYAIHDYKSLTEELNIVRQDYDDSEIIRKALSAKEGIPLVFIRSYLENTVGITNELLDIVYGGSLYLNDFDISPTEFNIPYTRKNMIIPDVSKASQGESSFISVALSFALSTQSMTKYDVLLLDEIDGTLDKENSHKFIRIIEHQTRNRGIEQTFIISHKGMFDMYPVDIIDLDFNPNPNPKLLNYIPVKLG